MNYLTQSQLVAAAPAAARMPKVRGGLIDSASFLEEIEANLGQRAVWAVQGTPHKDTRAKIRRERLGRHLIVCANSNGNATVLLNSHTVRRKAWLGAGFFRSDPPLFLLGVALPLRRWRGAEAALDELDRYRLPIARLRSEMIARSVDKSEITSLAFKVSKTAYLPGHKTISAYELAGASGSSLYGVMFSMLDLINRGNYASAEAARKVKPVRGPDALMHAANAMFVAGAELVDPTFALPIFRKT